MIFIKNIFHFIFPNCKKFPYILKGFVRYINDYLKLKSQLKQDSIGCHVRFDPFLFDSQVLQAFIQGREVDLNDRHKMLRDKYNQKY